MILYTYLFYPLIIHLLAHFFSKEIHCDTETLTTPPSVAIIIAVHNGEKYIRNKIKSLQLQNYPLDKIEFIFSSDGSTDNTLAILAEYDNITTIEGVERGGKAVALNRAVAATDAELIVFTDVRQRLSNNAVMDLVCMLSVDGVGAVSGELMQDTSAGSSSEQVGLYWRYEKSIRKSEAKLHSVPGVSGALYAIKRSDYPILQADTVLDDFEVPMSIIRQGKRVVFQNLAHAYDIVSDDISVEHARKIRTLMGNYQSMFRNGWLFSPIKNPIFWQFLSHKVFRLLVPYFLMIVFALPLIIGGAWMTLIFIAQCLFYITAYFGRTKMLKGILGRIASFCYFFTQMQITVVIALVKYLSESVDPRWRQVH